MRGERNCRCCGKGERRRLDHANNEPRSRRRGFRALPRVRISFASGKANLQIVSETSDGLDAVRRAKELHPDLILMDIGLPGLNGIEAARRIRELAPRSRIVFLSQGGSTEIVEEALRSGALGYVHKPRAGDDLYPAVAAVLEGQQFVSDGLMGSQEAVITLRHARKHRPCFEETPYLRFQRARP